VRLTFYDTSLNKKAVVFNWLSMLWQPKYNEVGSFVLEFQESSELFGLIKQLDYVVFDEDPDTVMMVWGIELKNKKVVISGHSAIYLLDQRVSDDVVKNENAELAMRRQVENMSPWDYVTLGDIQGLTDKYTAQTSDGSVLEYCLTISQFVDMGFRLRKSGKKLLFENYKPDLNRSVRFSAKLGNMGDERYSETEKEYKNVAIVAGAVIDGERVTVVVGNTAAVGVARREMYIDARDIQPEEGETREDYEARLSRRGENKLAQRVKIVNTSFTVLAEDVKLGDKVLLNPTYTNETLEARVVSMTYKSQNNRMQKTISIGQPIPTNRR
jgi:hypothetical protein